MHTKNVKKNSPKIIFSSVVGGCGATVDPGGCGVNGYVVSFVLSLFPAPNTPAVANLSLLLNCLDSIGSGSLPTVPAETQINIQLKLSLKNTWNHH